MVRTRKRQSPVDTEILDTIALLKDTLAEPDDASDLDEDYITASTNRGHKLERGARSVSMGRLETVAGDGYGVKVVEYYGNKRAVVYKKRRTIYEDVDEEEVDEWDEETPYDEIKLDDLLTPISDPGQVVTHPALSKTFTSPTLAVLARRTLDIICQEQEYVVKLAKLMSVFLGDDPSYLLAENLHLPKIEGDDAGEDNEEEGDDDNTNSRTSKIKEKNEPDTKHEIETERRMMTRQQATNEMDPFFAPPEIQVDYSLGISHEQAEETRQLTQIVQQRMEEFIRCMVNIRSGVLRADRFRRQVYNWCKEVGGGDELDDSVAKDPATGPPVEIEK